VLPATRRWTIPSTLIVTGVLGAAVLTFPGTAGATSTTTASPPTGVTIPSSAFSTTAATPAVTAATAPVTARTTVVRRTSRVVAAHLRRSATRPSHYYVVVSVQVASTTRTTASIKVGSAITSRVRRATAARTATSASAVAGSRAAAIRRARTAATTGARRLADVSAATTSRRAATAAARAAVLAGVPAPPPGPVSTSSVGAITMPKGNLPGLRQVFADDFATTTARGAFLKTYSSRWSAYGPGWKDTSGHGVYDGNRTLSTGGGLLDIYLHTEGSTHYVAAPTPKMPKMTYGRYSIRFQADSLPGYKAAWLLWPDDDVWPAHGEIDFPEGDLNSNFSAFSHYARSGGGQAPFTLSATFGRWHTATIDWLPGKVVFYLDGRVVGTNTRSVPSTPMHWVLQTETALRATAPASNVAGHVRIDWITAYAYTP